jgi:phosphatidate phosphatase PAH1
MQSVLLSLKNFVKDATATVKDATDYNSATLSGAVDVVAVRHDDGTFRRCAALDLVPIY